MSTVHSIVYITLYSALYTDIYIYSNVYTPLHVTYMSYQPTIWTADVLYSCEDVCSTGQQHGITLRLHVLYASARLLSHVPPPVKAVALLGLMDMVKHAGLGYDEGITLEGTCETPA